jgi:hypothetical protein
MLPLGENKTLEQIDGQAIAMRRGDHVQGSSA